MITSRTIEAQRDFYKSELIQMGYFKTPEGLQLYELSLTQLKEIYTEVKSQVENVERCRIDNDLFS
ncbi:Fur-regulated basic protein FbpA [Bacillus nitratireducens]|uniref:Fur-regulated basic protein FbpA n=1 Tax=Bacillus nitratireducens TaxID=2026193 RepID=UPI00119D2860|nr:Fur-regulated basic protein FbpA [Bacillus nitratireducens]